MSASRPLSPQSSPHECVGWFGKIPSRGDFVTRNLPLSFVEPWDEWLSAELSEAEVALADRWAEAYQAAQTCCYVTGPGVIDERCWYGILVPSFDRVGRRFPLTIALSPAPHAAVTGGPQWWSALVAIGRAALDPSGGAEVLDEALSRFVGDEAELIRRPDPASPVADAMLAIPTEDVSTWWPWCPQDRLGPLPVSVRGLPRGESFRSLLGASAGTHRRS